MLKKQQHITENVHISDLIRSALKEYKITVVNFAKESGNIMRNMKLSILKHGYLLLFGGIILISCKKGEGKLIDARKTVSEWQGKEIVFPEGLTFARFGTEPAESLLPSRGHKVLIYIDSLGCTQCKLQLPRWKEFIARTDSLTGGAVPFIFVIHPKERDVKEIYYILKLDNFDRPVCIDLEDNLNRQNCFPDNVAFQTFLLDEANRVVVIGSPVRNLAIKELYLKQLTGKVPALSTLTKTSVEAEPAEIDLGSFSNVEKQQIVYMLRNTGQESLKISDAAVSCDCISVEYDRHPAAPGETLRVVVGVSPKVNGFFEESITVECNSEKNVELIIRGNAL